jgi:hypothetical protein
MEDAKRLEATLEKASIKVYRSWHTGGSVCAAPESIKPKYLVIDSKGRVSIHDPLLSHPSTPHLTALGTVDVSKKSWPSDACTLYALPIEETVQPVVAEETAAATPWTQAKNAAGDIKGLEVTKDGDVRRTDGKPLVWDNTRPSRLRLGGRHADISVPDTILYTFVGPPPYSGCRATYIDSKLSGTVRRWAATNLQWSTRRPERPKMSEEQVDRIFEDFGKGLRACEIAVAMHVSGTTVSGVLRGHSHPDKDDLRRLCLAQRKKNKLPETSISQDMKRRLGT